MKWTTGRKERSPKEILGRMKTRTFRVGGYSVAATAIVAAIAVFANVFCPPNGPSLTPPPPSSIPCLSRQR